MASFTITEVYWCLPAFLPVCPVTHMPANDMRCSKPKQPSPSGWRMAAALRCYTEPSVWGQAGQAPPMGRSKGMPQLMGLLALLNGLWHLWIQSGYFPVRTQTVMSYLCSFTLLVKPSQSILPSTSISFSP